MIKLIISENTPGQAEELANRVAASEEIEVLGYARDGLEVAQMAAQLAPDVALIHTRLPGVTGFEACQMVTMAAPETACVLLAAAGEDLAAVQQQGMRVGARAVVAVDATERQLAEIVSEVAGLKEFKNQAEYQIVTDPAKMPVTIAVTGAKGGIGKTTLTTNLAVNLQQRFPGQVVVVDFVGQYGDVGLMLDLPQDRGIVELASLNLSPMEELDLNLVESYLQTHSSGLKVLLGPRVEELGTETSPVNVPYISVLLGLLRRAYRFIVLDLPPVVPPASAYVFSRCTYIVVVSYLLDLPAIRNTAALLAGLSAMKLPPERIKLVINRHNDSSQLTAADLQRASNWTPTVQIPEDVPMLTAAVNEGIPAILKAPNSPVAQSIRQLTESIIAELPR